MRIEHRLTKEQCLDLGWRIIDFFYERSVSDPFGWDWPTMWVLYPRKVRVFRRLKARYRELVPI